MKLGNGKIDSIQFIFNLIKQYEVKLFITFNFRSGRSSDRSRPSNSSFSFQNALIGPQDMSKIYKNTTTQKIFGTVSKLCEIGRCF